MPYIKTGTIKFIFTEFLNYCFNPDYSLNLRFTSNRPCEELTAGTKKISSFAINAPLLHLVPSSLLLFMKGISIIGGLISPVNGANFML